MAKEGDRLGDQPIEQSRDEVMNVLATTLDRVLNGDTQGDARDTGFVLVVFPFHGGGGRCNYISNADRSDVIMLLKEQLARFEGQAEVSGNA